MNLSTRVFLSYLLLFCAACLGGQTGTPTSDQGPDGVACDDPPDAPTALGVRDVDLWDAFEGEYVVSAWGQSIRSGEPLPFNPQMFTFHITRDESLPRPSTCDRVEVLVRMSWRGSAGGAGEAVASLVGTPTQGRLTLLRPENEDHPVHGTGVLVIEAGTVTSLQLSMSDVVWFLPLPEENP